MDNHKILILRLSAVGDVIRTLPAVKAIKNFFPFSYIAWVAEEPSAPLLENQPEINEVILFPRMRWADGIKSAKRIWGTIREVQRFVLDLRKRKFNIVLDFHGILKSGLISIVSGCPKRIGFGRKSSKEWNFLFSNIKVSVPEDRMSRFQKNFALLQGIGLDVKNFTPTFHAPIEDKEYIESFFKNLSEPVHKPIVAIHPGTSPKTFYKKWMPDQYAQLADRLIDELNAIVIFTWGPGELKWVEGIRREMKAPSILGPKTKTLTQLGEVFKRCDVYIGGDTGPMHIASLIGIPVVVIYGPTDPIVNEPFGEHKKVRKEVGCNPCRNRSCKALTCLRAITVDDVFIATKEILYLKS
jgi:heptosyltransferase-1